MKKSPVNIINTLLNLVVGITYEKTSVIAPFKMPIVLELGCYYNKIKPAQLYNHFVEIGSSSFILDLTGVHPVARFMIKMHKKSLADIWKPEYQVS